MNCQVGASLDVACPGVPVTPGITAAAPAPGTLFTVKPGVGPTPWRARATAYIAQRAHLPRTSGDGSGQLGSEQTRTRDG